MLALVDINRHGAKILFVTANPEQIGDAIHIAEGSSKPFDRAPNPVRGRIGSRRRGGLSPPPHKLRPKSSPRH